MICSLCLFVFDPEDQQEAVTTVSGYAVCARHARDRRARSGRGRLVLDAGHRGAVGLVAERSPKD